MSGKGYGSIDLISQVTEASKSRSGLPQAETVPRSGQVNDFRDGPGVAIGGTYGFAFEIGRLKPLLAEAEGVQLTVFQPGLGPAVRHDEYPQGHAGFLGHGVQPFDAMASVAVYNQGGERVPVQPGEPVRPEECHWQSFGIT